MMRVVARLRERSERGAAAVEFALVVLPLLVLVFGIISYGLMLTFRQSVSQAAAEGARAAAVAVVPDGDVAIGEAAKASKGYAAIDDALSVNGVQCVGGTLFVDDADAGSCAITFAECEPSESDADADSPSDAARCATATVAYDYQHFGKAPEFPGIGILLPNTLTYSATARVS